MQSKNKTVLINIIIAVVLFCIEYCGIFGTKYLGVLPFLPLGFLVTVAMFSTELGAVIIGVITGIFVDSVSSTGLGFNSIIFPIIALFVALISHYLFNNNIRSCLVLSLLSTLLFNIIKFFVFNVAVGFDGFFEFLLKTSVPSAVLTAVFSAVLYFFEKKLHSSSR